MPRTLDHLVLCVCDLEQARRSYAGLGFTLTPPATHPFGTANSLVQFAGLNFLELLALHDPVRIPPQAPDHFSFAAFNQAFLERIGEGASMLVFASHDARADVEAFRARGLVTYAPFDFGRKAVLPDGSVAEVGFSLAFVTHPDMPDAAFFTCQQRHPPERFWRPAYQGHANTALRLVEIVMSAPDPSALQAFFERLTESTGAAASDGPAVGPDTDRITVLKPAALGRRFPELADQPPGRSARIRAYCLRVRDLEAARATLDASGIAYRAASGSIVVPQAAAHGVCVELRAGDQAASASAAVG